MSKTRIGEVAPFPPLPGQPYPPSRNHPRWKELYRLNDEWMMKYWPFSSEDKRARLPFQNLAGFSTWCAPASDFDRMVWGGRIASIFFLADDYIDSGRMLDRIPGFKAAATGEGPLHPEDRAELCHDIVFRAVKATSHPRTFKQFTKCTHEWWDSNIHESFKNLDQYLAVRRVNIAIYFSNSYFRYCLDINLTDEQVNHPLMREAEGIISDHVGLTNDYFSYAKEHYTDSDDTNVLRILQDHEGVTYEEAKKIVEDKIKQKEQDYIPAGLAVLNHPELGKDPEVRRFIASLPYVMGGNKAWSQTSARYNLSDMPGTIPFPKLECEWEETPLADRVDDSFESQLRDRIFAVDKLPPADFALDTDPIEGGKTKTKTHSELAVDAGYDLAPAQVRHPRKDNIGITALSVSYGNALDGLKALLNKFAIQPSSVGRVIVAKERDQTPGLSVDDRAALLSLLGHEDVAIDVLNGDVSATALFQAVNWIDSRLWDGKNIVVSVSQGAGVVTLVVGPDAPIVVEPVCGSYTTAGTAGVSNGKANSSGASTPSVSASDEGYESEVKDKETEAKEYLTALIKSYDSYRTRRYGSDRDTPPPSSSSEAVEFDYTIFDRPALIPAVLALPHSKPSLLDSPKSCYDPTTTEDRLGPTLTFSGKHTGGSSIYWGIASVVGNVPSYVLFERRVSVFGMQPQIEFGGEEAVIFSLRVRADTKYIRDELLKETRLMNGSSPTTASPPPSVLSSSSA